MVDLTVGIKIQAQPTETDINKILSDGKRAGINYLDITINDCKEKCSMNELANHILRGMIDRKTGLHTGAIEVKDATLIFSEPDETSEYLTILASPDVDGVQKEYIGCWGEKYDTTFYISKILLPLSTSFCIKQIFIWQNYAPLELANVIERPYIVGYVHMGKSNFNHEHVKILTNNLLKSGITITDKNKELNQKKIEDIAWQAIQKDEVKYFDASYEEWNFKLGLGEDEEGNIKIIPQIPYKMKKSEDGECIDLAFYVERLIDVVDKFYLFGLNTSGF